MIEQLNETMKQAEESIGEAASLADAEALRVRYLGKKGALTDILRSMKNLSPEERKTLGQAANVARKALEDLINETIEVFRKREKEAELISETIDVTEPGIACPPGASHVLTIATDEIIRVFMGMGFSVSEGPEVDTVFNNFDALNAPKDHPSRDMSDTFYITEDVVLRTQTSPVQIRTLLSEKPPIKIIAPGRCFRSDTPDATHSPMFQQVEGLAVDEGIAMSDLKGVLDRFAKSLFGSSAKTRFRPHHFPFTEPSAEMDVSCFKCRGQGCRVCKYTGWIEILGCGMVHPNVLEVGDVDTERFTGFAFGMGVERIAMLKYEIDDIRLMYENDIRFIRQFI